MMKSRTRGAFLAVGCAGLTTNFSAQVTHCIVGANRRDNSPLVKVSML